MEGLHLLNSMLKSGDWFIKVDFKDAYFYEPVHLNHQRFLSSDGRGECSNLPASHLD